MINKSNIIILYIAIIHLILFLGLLLFSKFSGSISFGISLFSFLFLKMINDLGTKIPIKEVLSILILIQVFISPLFAYRYFDNKAHYTMHINEDLYMFYVLPGTLFFLAGLFIPFYKKPVNYTNLFNSLKKISNKKVEQVAFIFIITGLSITILQDNIPTSLLFVFYLLKLLKFIGVFLIFFSKNKLKYLWIALVYFQFSIEIVNGGVFYDLFVWGFFIYMLLETKLKSSLLRKTIIILSGFMTIYFVQAIKGAYRSEAWSNTKTKDNTELFINSIEDKADAGDVLESEDDFDRFISRLNNGWILSKVMEHTPKNEPFTNGETLKEDLINVLLPRFLFPNKAKTGGAQNQKKFTQFTGRRLIGTTTMRIGALSDAYINFGIVGGWLTLFFLGFTFNAILFFIVNLSLKNPFYILWIPFIFAYAIRMSDIQVILNYTFKALIFVIIINTFFFKVNSNPKSLKSK